MNKFKFYSLGLLSLISISLWEVPADIFELETQNLESPANTTKDEVLLGKVVSITAGAKANGFIDRAFSSTGSRVGDRGYFTLNQSLKGIPAGSKVEFEVSQVSKAKWGRFKSPGKMQLKALNIVFPDGRSARLEGQAFITNNTGETVLKGSSAKDRIKSGAISTGVGAGTGALGSLIGAAIGGGAKGKSTAIGTAIGGGIGLASAAIRKGKEVNIRSGDKLFLLFTQNANLEVN